MDLPSETAPRKPAIIGIDDAIRFHQDGARRWRMPHQGRRIAPSGLDTDSMDFRGVRAAIEVTATLPHEYDANGHRLSNDPTLVKTHMDLGLAAIQDAGTLPLDDRFTDGYRRWAEAIINEATTKAEKASNPQPPHPAA